MKKINCHRIEITIDERSNALFGYFTDKELGLKLSKGKGWFASDGTSQLVELVVFESEKDYIDYQYNEDEREAIKKMEKHLTPKQKVALINYFKQK